MRKSVFDTNLPRAPIIQGKIIIDMVDLIILRHTDRTRIATPVSCDAGLHTSTGIGNTAVGTRAHGQIPETWNRSWIE